MVILYASFAVDTILILFTLYWLRFKSYKTQETVLATCNEASVTIVLSLFCLGLSYFLIVAKGLDKTIAGTDSGSYWFIGGFSVISALLGCFSLLYTYVKKFIIVKDKLIVVNVLGKAKFIAWNDIKSVRIPMLSKNIVIKGARGSCMIHSGNNKQYKTFIEVLRHHVPKDHGGNVVNELYHRL